VRVRVRVRVLVPVPVLVLVLWKKPGATEFAVQDENTRKEYQKK
jgi:hypothetical protein